MKIEQLQPVSAWERSIKQFGWVLWGLRATPVINLVFVPQRLYFAPFFLIGLAFCEQTFFKVAVSKNVIPVDSDVRVLRGKFFGIIFFKVI